LRFRFVVAPPYLKIMRAWHLELFAKSSFG